MMVLLRMNALDDPQCPEQEVRLGLMFTLASGSLLLSLFVMGLFLDR